MVQYTRDRFTRVKSIIARNKDGTVLTPQTAV